MKYDWKKTEKELYGVKKDPILVRVPQQRFIMLSGEGNPNDRSFSERVGALYSLAYGIKMSCKALAEQSDGVIQDFCVYPLEGIWGRKDGGEFSKDELYYTIMIRQPDFVSEDMVREALEKCRKKKPSPLLDEIVFDTMEDGLCVEVLHTGSYDSEPESFDRLERFAQQNGYERASVRHREIYLSNANRTAPDKLKTILRYQVREEAHAAATVYGAEEC